MAKKKLGKVTVELVITQPKRYRIGKVVVPPLAPVKDWDIEDIYMGFTLTQAVEKVIKMTDPTEAWAWLAKWYLRELPPPEMLQES